MKTLLRILLFLSFIGLLLSVPAAILIRNRLENRVLGVWTANQRARYDQWKDQKLTLPPEALTVTPFSDETRAAADTFFDAWAENEVTAEAVAKMLSGSGRHEISSLNDDPSGFKTPVELPALEPLIAAFQSLVQQPDYEMHVLAFDRDPAQGFGPPIPNYLRHQTMAKLLAIKTLALLKEGREDEALSTAAAILRASRVEKYSTLISKLFGIAICAIGTHAWDFAVIHCDDPDLLRDTLHEQNKIVPALKFVVEDLDLGAADHIGILRNLRRLGIDVKIQGLTGWELLVESQRGELEYLEKVVLPAAGDDEVRRIAGIQVTIDSTRSALEASLGDGIRGAFILPYTRAMHYRYIYPNVEEAHVRDLVARSQFDLLRSRTAHKLYTLEHGGEPEAMADLVPDYLPEIPPDLFSDDGAPYRRNTSVYYSIGPDRTDQSGTVLYDPTNGTTGGGDVFLGS